MPLGEAKPDHEARCGSDQHQPESKLDLGQRRETNRSEARRDQRSHLAKLSDLQGRIRSEDRLKGVCGCAGIGRPHEHHLMRLASRRLPNKGGVRDQKGVLRRRWEFPDEADKGEWHDMILMVDGRLQAKIERVAWVELKVADRSEERR